jgi:hypothetical protein
VDDSDIESCGTAENELETKRELENEQEQEQGQGQEQEQEQEQGQGQGQENEDKNQTSLEAFSPDTSSELDNSTVDDSLDEENRMFRSKVHLSSPTEVLLQERLDEAVADIKILRHKLIKNESELQDQNNKLERVKFQRDLLESAQKERDLSRGEPIEAFALRKDQYIDKIVKELNDRERLGAFTTFSQISSASRTRKSIQEGFKEIYFNSQTISCQYDRDRPFFVPSFEKYNELRLLVCKGLDMDPQKTIRDIDSKAQLSKLAPQAIIRALTTSALREWIFEDDFPSFGNVTELFAKYRESIAKLGTPIHHLRDTEESSS